MIRVREIDDRVTTINDTDILSADLIIEIGSDDAFCAYITSLACNWSIYYACACGRVTDFSAPELAAMAFYTGVTGEINIAFAKATTAQVTDFKSRL